MNDKKFLMIGEGNVGKTTYVNRLEIVKRLAEDRFLVSIPNEQTTFANDENKGCELTVISSLWNGNDIDFNKTHFDGVLIMFESGKDDRILKWRLYFSRTYKEIPIVFVRNKSDLGENRGDGFMKENFPECYFSVSSLNSTQEELIKPLQWLDKQQK